MFLFPTFFFLARYQNSVIMIIAFLWGFLPRLQFSKLKNVDVAELCRGHGVEKEWMDVRLFSSPDLRRC